MKARSEKILLTCLLATVSLCWVGYTHTTHAAETKLPELHPDTQAFFKTYCARCHGAEQQEGKFQLDNLSLDFSQEMIAQRWSEVVFRINSGEMPPADEPQPQPAEIGQAVDWISARIKEGEAARMARRGPVAHYRLSREEYGHTIYDLLGVYFDVNQPGAFNADPLWHGYDRIGSLLSLSPSHVERYFRAAETVLEEAFPEKPPKFQQGRREANAGHEKQLEQQELAGPVRWLLWPDQSQNLIRATSPGLYRFRIQLSGLPSFKGRLPHLAIWDHALKQSVLGIDVEAPEDQPQMIELEVFLPAGTFSIKNESPGMLSDQHTLSNSKFQFINTQLTRQNKPTGYKLFDDEGRPIFPMLIIDWIEFEGPILLESDKQKRAGLLPEKEGDLAEARDSLKRFATRAWRRPITDAELDRYVHVIESELSAGEKFASAYRAAMVAIMTSKNFYYLEEGSPNEKRSRINDWELASRLSYFLWSSLPDEELFDLAAQGKLHQPQVLKAQLKRMLDDEKSERFQKSFPQQWLQLHRVGMFAPDPEIFPDYDKWLEESLVLETTGYFSEVLEKNLSLREFLVSDWTMLNPRLAMHYELPRLPSAELQRVKLRPEDHRGGLLTQASILSLTSDGTRHRPVHRGVWVSEAIFGRTPPPPPPNVEPLEATSGDQPKATIRMQLEAHATHAICASCHQKIDPLGFAFDNFDAIGRWRTEEEALGGQGDNPPVNASGVLPDGRMYADSAEFKALLAEDLDRFAEAFTEQLATYALRRVMTIDDASEIHAIAAASKADDYRLQTVIENFVMSGLFQKR